jgi:protein kinase A
MQPNFCLLLDYLIHFLYSYESFHDKFNLYLAFEYVQGGEIFRLLRREYFFPNDVALFYVTEIVLAFEYLHGRGIAYRDLKPENLLIGADGHLKITDFGFAKRIPAGTRTYTLCGTPEYLAPEVIMNMGHSHGVDWWSLGVLLFEMLAGYPPFYDTNIYETYRKITIGKYEFPQSVPMNARSLISMLLQIDPNRRLGCL